jgi:hypothetical protein
MKYVESGTSDSYTDRLGRVVSANKTAARNGLASS